MKSGRIQTWFTERNYGWVREDLGANSYFLHGTAYDGDPADLKKGAHLEFDVVSYEHRGEQRTKAINGRLVTEVRCGNN